MLNIKKYINLAIAAAALCFVTSLIVDRIYPPPVPVALTRVDSSTYGGKIVVPYDAVRQYNSGEEYVYILSDGQAEVRLIVTAAEYDDGFEVIDGISDGEVIIMNPDDLSGETMRVKAK